MKKKMLMLSYRAPYPVVSGEKIRMFQNIQMLSDKYDIDLVYIDDNRVGADVSELKKYCSQIVDFKSSKILHYFNTLKGLLFSRLPLQVNYYYNKKLFRWIKDNIGNYDIVFCNHLRTAIYVLKYDNIYKVIDCVDAIAMNYDNAKKVSKGFKKLLYSVEYSRVKKFEVKVYEKFHKKLIISDTDKDYIQRLGVRDEPIVIGNYARDLGYRESKMDGREISFIGKMSTEPNVNAVKYFLNNIFPCVKEKYNDLLFNIIGGSPSNEILSMNKVEGVNVTGFVEDPAEILCKSKVVIAPMVSGSGIQNKILESMLLGKVVLTTPVGATGLVNLTGHELIVCNDAKDFINKLNFYLNDDNIASVEKVGKAARNYALTYYSYESIKEELLGNISDDFILINNNQNKVAVFD